MRLWALLLLPFCAAPDVERQSGVVDWLAARLGVREAFSQARLSRIVEAFEAQLDLERKANDLDYDESGRLKFSATGQAGEIAENIGDAKGGATALRMTYTRQRHYGARHIAARLRQIDYTLDRMLANCRIARWFALVGPSAVCLPDALFARGVTLLDGNWVTNAAGFIDALKRGESTSSCARKTALTPVSNPGTETLLKSMGRESAPVIRQVTANRRRESTP